MKALTLHQPVATLMGLKDIENRKWKPPAAILGQRIAIHAGKKWNEEYATWARRLTEHDTFDGPVTAEAIEKARGIQGAIVSTAIVTAWYDKRHATSGWVVDNSDIIAYIKCSPWFQGPVGWHMTDFKFLREPLPCKGALGLWRVPDDLDSRLEDML